MNIQERLQEIKRTAIASHDELRTGHTYLDDSDIFWLIEQAEKVQQQAEQIGELQASCRLKQGHIDHIPTIRSEYEAKIAELQQAIYSMRKAGLK